MKDLPLASLLGAMLDLGYEDISCNGFSDEDGKSIGGSKSHYDGTNGDFKYLRTDGRTNLEASLHINEQPDQLDEVRQIELMDALRKYGWKGMLTYRYQKNGVTHLLPNSIHAENHHHHLHVQRYSPRVEETHE
jgi:hypothetical protein